LDYSSSAPFHYIKKIVLERFGCPELVLERDPRGVTLSAVGSSCGIFFPPFLGNASTAELLSRPDAKLRMLPVDYFVKETIKEQAIPAFFIGDAPVPRQLVSFGENEVRFHFDLLGTVFFILTRMEEIKSPIRDEHCRFPASASHAFKNEYLLRPVVDELTEVLWNCVKHLWPGLERKKKEFKIFLSHDVDIPFAEAFSGPGRILRYFAGDVIKRKEFSRAFKRIRNLVSVRRGDFRKDTNYTFDRIMDISEKHGLKSAFYFKTDCTNGKFDIPYPIQHPFLREMLRDIHNRGHEWVHRSKLSHRSDDVEPVFRKN
jgi:hypothetical protein